MYYIILVNALILFREGGQRKFFLQLITESIYIPVVQESSKNVQIKDSMFNNLETEGKQV